MSELPLDAPQARYVISMLRVHMGPSAPDEDGMRAELDATGHGVTLFKGDTFWQVDRDSVVETTKLPDGSVDEKKWRFGQSSPVRR